MGGRTEKSAYTFPSNLLYPTIHFFSTPNSSRYPLLYYRTYLLENQESFIQIFFLSPCLAIFNTQLPSSGLYEKSCCSLSLLSDPNCNGYIPHISPNTSWHSLGTHQLSMPGKHVRQQKTFKASFPSLTPMPWSYLYCCTEHQLFLSPAHITCGFQRPLPPNLLHTICCCI